MDGCDGESPPAAAGEPESEVSGSRSSRRYSRGELVALGSAVPAEEQRRLWAEVHGRLADEGFSGEYEGLRAAEEPPRRGKKGKKTGGGGGDGRKKDEAVVAQLLEVSEISSSRSIDVKISSESHHANAHDTSEAPEVIEEYLDKCECIDYEDDFSDDDYESILKPAFIVEGDPDFASGPPLDGFEYLRRVRWETAQIPKVTVAKIDLSKTRSDQTPYMPQIPQIPKCPPTLSASKQWEDTFLAYFAEIRLAFSKLDSSCDETSAAAGSKDSPKPVSRSVPQTIPTVTMIRSMDAVSRAATLRNYIDMVESFTALSRNDCLWLFSLCVTVDAPLHAETSASLRSLLRKCMGILSTKSEVDDEVVMLNILIAISGKYFGQYDNLYV